MTLCIAAIAERNGKDDQKVLLATDGMLSLDYASFDSTVLKAMPLTKRKRFTIAFAGSPHHAQAINFHALELLEGKEETFPFVMRACELAFQKELTRKIESEVLSPLGYDRPTFLREGRNNLGDEEFGRLVYEIRNTKLDTTILVCGFDASRVPRLFSVADPGVATSHEAAGFYAIGSGSFNALGSLYNTYESGIGPWPVLAYRICEAKFLGESAPGVGRNTSMMLIEADGSTRLMPPKPIDDVREAWWLHGRPKIPEGICEKIEKQGFQVRIKPGAAGG